MSYLDLRFLPSINNVSVVGDKKLSDYGLLPINPDEILEIEYEVFGYTT